jgi:hypothetical protein
MAKHLFEDFLTNPEAYERCVRVWENLMADRSESGGAIKEWRPWRPTTYGDGVTPLPRDGQPIYNARSDRLQKAVAIYQGPPSREEVEIAAWLTRFEYQNTEHSYTEELAINLSLSAESLEIARELITAWMDRGTSYDDMQRKIDTTLKDISE